MHDSLGEPIHGELHSTDASGGGQVLFYTSGTTTVRTLAANEYVEIHSIEVVSVPGGDTQLFLSTSATPTVGDAVVRATLAANSGLVMSKMHMVGINAANLFVISPAGVIDVNITGAIRKGKSEAVYPSWQSRLNA